MHHHTAARTSGALVTLMACLVSATALAQAPTFEPDPSNRLELDVARAIVDIKAIDPGMQQWFDNAAGYAVFPSVGKGGIIIGGARGQGLVIDAGTVIGRTSITQFTIGLQLGGQVYAQFIFFRDEVALNEFKRGNFELGAQASAVAVTLGASTDANYNQGVAIFTNASGGLMFEASVGGQRFTFEPIE